MVMQIELSDEQAQSLERIAVRKGQSVPELILTSVASLLRDEASANREAVKRRALSAIGRHSAGPADLATQHDKYLEEAYGD